MITWNVAGPLGTIVPGVPAFGVVAGQVYNYYVFSVGSNPGSQFSVILQSLTGDADLYGRGGICYGCTCVMATVWLRGGRYIKASTTMINALDYPTMSNADWYGRCGRRTRAVLSPRSQAVEQQPERQRADHER